MSLVYFVLKFAMNFDFIVMKSFFYANKSLNIRWPCAASQISYAFNFNVLSWFNLSAIWIICFVIIPNKSKKKNKSIIRFIKLNASYLSHLGLLFTSQNHQNNMISTTVRLPQNSCEFSKSFKRCDYVAKKTTKNTRSYRLDLIHEWNIVSTWNVNIYLR